MILHKTLTGLGLRLDLTEVTITDIKVHDTLEEVLKIYDQCLLQPELAKAAYGLAVGGTALALNCTIHTGALLVEHALELRKLRHEPRRGPKRNDKHIHQPGADAGHSDVHRPGVGGQAGDSESPDDGHRGAPVTTP